MSQLNTYAPTGNPEPRWAISTADLPAHKSKTAFTIDGNPTVLIGNRWRQVLEGLMIGPIYCASAVRLSDAVLILRRNYDVSIETETTPQGRKFYRLKSTVTVTEVAA